LKVNDLQIASLKMSELKPEQLAEFKVCFNHFDLDRDNQLSANEFRAGCASLGIEIQVRYFGPLVDEISSLT
jgi:Ca2+-binding EF-hand superfamily protein